MRVYGFNETETREGTNYYVLLTRSLNSARGTPNLFALVY